MASQSIAFSCTCGQVHGTITGVAPNKGSHLKCYCKSCQTAAHVLGDDNALDANGGTDVFQTVPSKINFAAGEDKLACLRLSPKGLLRWYASCCDAPLFSMPNVSWLALAGVNIARVKPEDRAAFGAIRGLNAAKHAIDPPSNLVDFGVKRAMARLVWRAAKARVRGDSTAPFFTSKGDIAVTPRVLSREERQTAAPH